MLTLAFATGTEPGKWFRRYLEATDHGLDARGADDPLSLLEAGECVVALMRLPDARVSEEHHRVILYEEAPGVAVPKGSLYAELGERVLIDDLADEPVNFAYAPGAEIDQLRAALQVVAANVGVAFAPKPLLKALSKKQVTVLDVEGETTPVALVWRKSDDGDAVQDFVGIAKGRSVRSSRNAPRKARTRKYR
ncbi:LysR substrate binding domain-containing protein [Corynebacterium mycetoides]|uniref:LysR substrate binding domain-containing protein n=1 Tax=Corynebacterium mycetoides TaxID=38302 RepID=A0A1G9LKI5_9CORY|nr:LysR family transcriptional regulator substrate-binding protein [Corynebacterium mycetoides]SDL62406.1 LysR substrate binding domain-containing protein [Corynebacterium mycetoides]